VADGVDGKRAAAEQYSRYDSDLCDAGLWAGGAQRSVQWSGEVRDTHLDNLPIDGANNC
jgi:hypothetical protein